MEKALELARQGVLVDDTFAPAYISLAGAYLTKRQHEDALAAASEAVRIEPGGYNSNMWLGFYLHWMGRGEEAVKAVKKAQQLLKRYPSFSLSSWNYARTYKNPEDTERLLNALRKAGLK